MDWNRIEGNWSQFMAAAKSRWEKLTEDQLLVVAGRREWLAGSIQETYGITREASHRQIDQWQADQKPPTQGADETGERLAGRGDRR
jgi:uncharacterized protein YjbJ (UPF0337 family)